MTDLKAECSRLRGLGRSAPTLESRRAAIGALSSKFESIQVEGGKLLARWGGKQEVESLKKWLISTCAKPKSHAVRLQAAKALAPWVKLQDADWILDLYFSRTKAGEPHFLLPLISALPSKGWRSRIRKEIRSPSVTRRRAAALAVARNSFPGKRELLQRLRHDSEPDIKALATAQLRRDAAAV
jgi:hypothetical protein